ncbi:hypothetical protein N431DRAFT_440925 [Stipitochalara longipes BDJ]|nr:hypothetical protein N431DRAFT_440925 [Stipitochalara longipes BDJ]
MAYNINDQAVAFARARHPENLAYELMLTRREVLHLREQNEALKAVNIQTNNDLIQARQHKNEVADLLRTREEDLLFANHERDNFQRQPTTEQNEKSGWNDYCGDLWVRLAAKEQRIQSLAEMCEGAYRQVTDLQQLLTDPLKERRKGKIEQHAHIKTHGLLMTEEEKCEALRQKLIKAKKENESATQRMWSFSNDGNAVARKLKWWKKRARMYKIALKNHKMRGSVLKKTMRAKILHLTAKLDNRSQSIRADGEKLQAGSQARPYNAEQEDRISEKIQDGDSNVPVHIILNEEVNNINPRLLASQESLLIFRLLLFYVSLQGHETKTHQGTHICDRSLVCLVPDSAKRNHEFISLKTPQSSNIFLYNHANSSVMANRRPPQEIWNFKDEQSEPEQSTSSGSQSQASSPSSQSADNVLKPQVQSLAALQARILQLQSRNDTLTRRLEDASADKEVLEQEMLNRHEEIERLNLRNGLQERELRQERFQIHQQRNRINQLVNQVRTLQVQSGAMAAEIQRQQGQQTSSEVRRLAQIAALLALGGGNGDEFLTDEEV